jgi:hypothetical protein
MVLRDGLARLRPRDMFLYGRYIARTIALFRRPWSGLFALPPMRTDPRRDRASSVLNAIGQVAAGEPVDMVPTTDIDAIAQPLARTTLLKIDCEGAEEEILAGASDDTLRSVDAIRLEFHGDAGPDIRQLLQTRGFAPRSGQAAVDDWYGWFVASGTRS